jgi:hypothetical protein
MNKEDLKGLVKRYFGLVEAVEEPTAEIESKEAFAEVKTADGNVTLYYDGDLGVGTELKIEDAEGNMIPAPEGDHFIVYDEKQWRVVLDAAGTIIELDEMEAETEAMGEHGEEEEMVDVITPGKEKGPATMISFQDIEEVVEAVVDAVKEEMMKKFADYEEKIETMSKTVESFSKQPASEKTLPTSNRDKFQKKPEYKAFDESRLEAAMERFAKRKK